MDENFKEKNFNEDIAKKLFEKKLFIVFEGIDGSGKDTQMFLFLKYLKEKNKYLDVLFTREPTKITNAGKRVSELLKENKISKDDALKLFVQDRIEHSRIIKDSLKYFYVLSSRFYPSTFLYQLAQGVSFDEIFKLHKFGKEDGAIVPDLIFYFKIDLNTGLDRINSRGEDIEVFENKKFFERLLEQEDFVLNKLQEEFKNIIIIDGTKSIDEVNKDLIEQFEKYLLNS